MLSNPPYGKSWKSDQERMGGKAGIKDPRFLIQHANDAEYSLITRSSDGQMLFLANMLSKMKQNTPPGEPNRGSSQTARHCSRRTPAGRKQHPAMDYRKRFGLSDCRAAAQQF